MVKRHEILRSIYEEEGGQVYQRLLPGDEWQLTEATNPMFVNNAKELNAYIQRVIQAPFNLAADYMLRAALIELTTADYVLVLTIHHIASDAWSIPVIVREVAELYSTSLANRPSNLHPLPLQYSDYAIWQREYLSRDTLHAKLEYWKYKLEETAPLQLPTDYTRPATISSRGAAREFRIEPALAAGIRTLSQENGTTLYMSLLGSIQGILYRYSGQKDISVGTSIAGRPQEELEQLIGFFVNTLALRDQVNGEATFTTLLAR